MVDKTIFQKNYEENTTAAYNIIALLSRGLHKYGEHIIYMYNIIFVYWCARDINVWETGSKQ